ncbi:MAG TPA: ribosomal-protein-alanine N-acetyltransferase [Nitrospirae bacterium]|nr:ribosomal-protein-alanine N-acetyltransferase [bacterium BMS3Abin09]GBE40472.1 ribosomal-protein-alanine N-acetyltransferase [bacterium BMS3Bbin09]HDN95170.1 ribosomal-protein-alanine N-acetyltransferase [Nitrospirota bacterium]HDO67453.1 ribosomal-protein-alanine N-acetyltransferase [Nitrospirota bacterium]HDZ84440.1 ribosomal-protein-alanine N-acetyltransferase [Nitrospirota bacterium]
MEGVTVRDISSDDLPQVKAIEDRIFTTPWSLKSFKYEIKNKDAVLKVAEKNSLIIGFICIRSFLDATHIMDIAVIQEHCKQGVGGMLLLEALREIRKAKPETEHITLEVRESNIAAIKLYEKFNFRETGSRKDYYSDPKEDGIIMGLDLDTEIPA